MIYYRNNNGDIGECSNYIEITLLTAFIKLYKKKNTRNRLRQIEYPQLEDM